MSWLFASSQHTDQSSTPKAYNPSAAHQAIFAGTGALAGLASLPIECAWLSLQKSPSSKAVHLFLRGQAPAVIISTGVRFWGFNQIKEKINHDPTDTKPQWLTYSLGGAAGGIGETFAMHLPKDFRNLQAGVTQNQAFLTDWLIPLGTKAARHAAKLSLCFGTFGYLSTTYSELTPLNSFWKCWAMGTCAGGVGTAVMGTIDRMLVKNPPLSAMPKGAMVIGTVISVQVTSAAALLQLWQIEG